MRKTTRKSRDDVPTLPGSKLTGVVGIFFITLSALRIFTHFERGRASYEKHLYKDKFVVVLNPQMGHDDINARLYGQYNRGH